MMSEIPDDILKDAKSVHLSLIGRGIDSSIRVIARAILAERERCIDIAHDQAENWRNMAYSGDRSIAAEVIAAAIRREV
jgi:hypothetical protein